MELKKMKRISVMWGAMLLTVFVGLTAIGFIYKNKVSKYEDLEKTLETSVKQYVELKFLYPSDGESITINSKELIENNIIESLEIDGNSCEGYVVLSKKTSVYSYKSYIKCNDYKTKNYDKYVK